MNINKALPALLATSSRDNANAIINIDARAFLIVTFFYILSLLALPLGNPSLVIWYAVYPVILAPLCGFNYTDILKKSLIVLPFVVLLGIFNPLYQKEIAFTVGNIPVSVGWLTFTTILLRALFSMQVLLILILSQGFINICNALGKLGVPKVLTVQLFFLYRYLWVLIDETLIMKRSVESRGYGKKAYKIGFWTKFVGSLFLRTYERAKRIHNAMLSRGFTGEIKMGKNISWGKGDYLFIITCVCLFIFLHFVDLSQIIFSNVA